MSMPAAPPAPTLPPTPTPLSRSRRAQAFLFGGCLLALMNFSSPAAGIIDIPVSFFMKNRLHLTSNELAVFKLWVGAPLFLAFVLGFIRDRWSPFGGGDKAHLLVFALVTAAFYGVMAVVEPTYWVFLIGLFIATITFRMVSAAAYGIAAAIGQRHAVTGRMSGVVNIASAVPDLISFIGGGLLSQTLEGQGAAAAARTLFLCAAAIMVSIAVLGLTGPRWVYDETRQEVGRTDLLGDLKRIVRHWPIYPAMLIQLLWQFSPGTGTVLQYHIVDKLRATDAQWGAWQGIFFGSFIPVYAAYGLLSRRFALRPLLWVGFGIAVFQMVPLLLVQNAAAALIAAVPMGLLGGLAQAALVDLVIRSSPPGLRGTTMMLFYALYYVSARFGDLFGTWIYDRHGGFIPTVVITIGVYVAILPVLLLVSRELTATKDAGAVA